MFEDMSPDDKYSMGLLLGESIAGLFDIIAKIDDISVQEAVDQWVESYIADKIIKATEETNG